MRLQPKVVLLIRNEGVLVGCPQISICGDLVRQINFKEASRRAIHSFQLRHSLFFTIIAARQLRRLI